MKELTVVITKGIPASGKSTWAKEKVLQGGGRWKRINKDLLRLMLDCVQWDETKESFIQKAQTVLLHTCLLNEYNVIIDETNLDPIREKDIREVANIYGAKVEIKWFPISLEEAIKRDKNREASVGENVICSKYEKYIECGGPSIIDMSLLPTTSNTRDWVCEELFEMRQHELEIGA